MELREKIGTEDSDRSQQGCIHQLFEAQVTQNPDSVAVIFNNQKLTYRLLDRQANQIARYLQKLGVGADVLVGLCVDRSLEMIVGILGILKAGGAYVPLDPTYPKERLAYMVEDARVPVLFTQEHLLASIPDYTTQVVCLDGDWHSIAQESQLPPNNNANPENLAYVIYTSGSTGKPKGVAIEHRSLVNFSQAASKVYDITHRDRVLQFASISFDAAVEEIFTTLIQGGTLVLRTKEMLRSIPAFLEACQKLDITVLDLPTAFWHQICAELATENVRLTESIRTVIIGGERALPQWLEVWQKRVEPRVRLINGYGPTEITVAAIACDLAGENAVDTSGRILPIGKPFDNLKVWVLDENLQPVSEGEPGELYIGGLGLARGYLHRPDLTAEKFIFLGKDRLYKTGDLVRYRPDGNLEFLSRIDHQEKIRGFRVELQEIESILEQHPAVREAIAIAREDIPGDKRVVAYVVPDPGAYILEEKTLSEQLEAQQVSLWQTIHDDDSFNAVDSDWESTFNISGWYSSYTGELIPDEEMREWLDNTLERILTLKPTRVLEIGCGTGLILFGVAPSCDRYVGTDISQVSLRHIEQQLTRLNLDRVHVSQRTADNLRGMTAGSFDSVIINSVIQYFPSTDYLFRVIDGAAKVVEPGGFIFIGDVRSYPLLEAFCTAIELQQSPASTPTEEIQRRVKKRLRQEEELTLDPAFFWALQQHIPQISHVQVKLRRGKYLNELTQFRYDVILHIGKTKTSLIEPTWLDWQQQKLTFERIRDQLQAENPENLAITNIPNSRIQREVKAVELLGSHNRPATVGEMQETLEEMSQWGVDPEAFWKLTEALPYEVEISWLTSGVEGTYAVFLHRKGDGEMPLPIFAKPALKPLNTYANNPLQGKIAHYLVPQIRSFLKEKLPGYMIPSAFVVMDSFPLTVNGKVDRRSLPAPASTRPILDEEYIAPTTPIERRIADIWSQLLAIEEIGVKDNFFELGGHSLLTTQMIAQVEAAFQVILPLLSFFKAPTIAGLATAIAETQHPESIPHGTGFMTLAQLKAEAVLDETIYPDSPYKGFPNQAKAIFLTGATGFLGGFLLNALIEQTQANIYCLVRAVSLEEGKERIRQNLEACQLWKEELSDRITPVIGDLAKPLLGLSQQKFQELADTVEVIYHNGAFVNLVYPYSALKAVNVLGTQEILRLASLIKTKPVHFISTLDVFESDVCAGVVAIKEDDRPNSGEGLAGGYAQSKWVAEQLIATARERGIPTCIYRPGMIAGHSQTGVSNLEDLNCRMLKGFIQLGSAPSLDMAIDMTPVDYVSGAIAHLSQQPESLGKAFHLFNPHPLHLNKLVNAVRSFGYQLQTISYEKWQEALNEISKQSKDNALSPLSSVLLEKISSTHLTHLEMWLVGEEIFDCQNTLNGLTKVSISCPPVDESLLAIYFAHFKQVGFLV